MQIIIYALLNYINCSIKQDTNYDIAKIMLLHIQDIENYTLEETAQLCHVSVSTLNRFCRIIGYKNFSTLRNFIKMKEDKSYLFETNQSDNSEIEKINENLLAIEKIPDSLFEKVAHVIHDSKRIILVGFGEFQFPALYFQKQMLSLGKLVEIYGQINELEFQTEFNSNDLIIFTSLKGKIIEKYKDSLLKMDCKKILLTQIHDKEKLNQFDHHLILGMNEEERLRKYAILRVYEKIILEYYQLYQKKVME